MTFVEFPFKGLRFIMFTASRLLLICAPVILSACVYTGAGQAPSARVDLPETDTADYRGLEIEARYDIESVAFSHDGSLLLARISRTANASRFVVINLETHTAEPIPLACGYTFSDGAVLHGGYVAFLARPFPRLAHHDPMTAPNIVIGTLEGETLRWAGPFEETYPGEDGPVTFGVFPDQISPSSDPGVFYASEYAGKHPAILRIDIHSGSHEVVYPLNWYRWDAIFRFTRIRSELNQGIQMNGDVSYRTLRNLGDPERALSDLRESGGTDDLLAQFEDGYGFQDIRATFDIRDGVLSIHPPPDVGVVISSWQTPTGTYVYGNLFTSEDRDERSWGIAVVEPDGDFRFIRSMHFGTRYDLDRNGRLFAEIRPGPRVYDDQLGSYGIRYSNVNQRLRIIELETGRIQSVFDSELAEAYERDACVIERDRKTGFGQ